MGADSQGRPGQASQAARLTSSTTASSRRGGTRVIKTDEATLFSGLEAIVSASGGAGDRVGLRLGQCSWQLWNGQGRSTWTPPTPRAGSLPLPTRQGQPPHGASTPPSHKRGGRCPPGKGRGPPGDLATEGAAAVLTARPPTCTPGGTKGSPTLLTSPMINFPPPRSMREGPLLQLPTLGTTDC